ncbi:hypothetical protein HPULCUR_006213 [Helicostylum pulchrum]|uniref:BAR-domain-containing protein n=1 Tax=Helicostylum pulchrum TaxID=562976 RepID=A0ABP9Y199_9FUNG
MSWKDAGYMQLEKTFNDFSKLVDVLANDARIFRDSIAALLSNQAAMTQYLSAIYDASIGAEAAEGAIQKRFQQTPAAQAQSVNDAEAAMAYCRDEVLPELDVVDRDIVRPLLELSEIQKTIGKTMLKRNHKLIDFDRHRIALQKITTKTERSFSEEKQIFKIQQQLDTATQDYNYLNDMLKSELPRFFQLKTDFIQPVFENLFNMQARIYGMIYARCYELLNQNMEAFMTNTMGIEEGYNWRRQQRDVRAEIENMDLLKSGGKAWLAVSGGANSSKLTLQERAAIKQQEALGIAPAPTIQAIEYGGMSKANEAYGYQQQQTSPLPSPPAYTPVFNVAPQQQQQQQQKFVVALYDYAAQAEGDLSFKKDDRIEIIQKTADTNDWWTGRINGMTGVFPGNYVQEL